MRSARDAGRLMLQLLTAPLVVLRRRFAADDEPCARGCAGCSDRPCYEEAP